MPTIHSFFLSRRDPVLPPAPRAIRRRGWSESNHPLARCFSFFPVAFFCLAIPVPSPAQQALLPPSFQPGFEYLIRSQQSLETVLGPGLPNAGKQVADVTLELLAACRPSPSGPARREVSIQLAKVRMDVLMGGLKIAYDSTQPASAETLLGQNLHGLVGQAFVLTLDAEDHIVRVEGAEKFAVPASPLGQQLGVEQLTQMAMPMFTLGMPREGVKPGQTWEHVKDSSMGPAGKLQASYQVTYEGEQDGVALCRYQAHLQIHPGQAGAANAAPSRVSLEEGTLSGTVRVDKSKQFPTEGAGEGHLTLSVPGPADAGQPVQLPITQRRSFELLRMRPLPVGE